MLLITIFLMALLSASLARPSGAPIEACQTMVPGHKEPPQETPPPYTISATRNATAPIYHVVLHGARFKGFILQARFVGNGSLVEGRFSPDNLSKPIGCSTNTMNTLTHTNNYEKTEIKTVWSPKSFFTEPFVFRATVVKDFSTYWLGVDSQPIILETYSVDANSECGVTRGCFGLPSNCVQKENQCQVLVMFRPVRNVIQFHLIAALGASEGWAAVGLSQDAKMGEDLVTECYLDPSQGVKVQQSWNFGQPTKYNVLLELDSLQAMSGIYDNGVLTCSWQQTAQSIRGVQFDPKTQEYFLLLAKGPMSAFQTKQEHTVRLPSAYLVNLTSPTLVVGKPSLLIKLHGSMMVASWLGLVSLGMLIARYYKTVWEGSLCCNTKMWLAVHRCIMFLGVSVIIGAFVVIFIYEDGWTSNTNTWHPILGCVATGLACLQILGGLLRPSPASSLRPTFNFFHWLSGNAAHITAVVTIFLALDLKEANLPPLFLWLLLGFVAFHFAMHLILQFHSCVMARKTSETDQSESIEGNTSGKLQRTPDSDGPGSGFRKLILGIYLVCVIVALSILILLIWFN